MSHPTPQLISLLKVKCLANNFQEAKPFYYKGFELYYCKINLYACEHYGKVIENKAICKGALRMAMESSKELSDFVNSEKLLEDSNGMQKGDLI